MKKILMCAALFSAALQAYSQGCSNLVTNGNFSAGNSGFTTQYSYNPASVVGEGTYAVVSQFNTVHSAFFGNDHTNPPTGLAVIVNGSPSSNAKVWEQTISGIIPNTTYYFSTWVNKQNGNPPPTLQFSINNALIGTPFTPTTTPNVWQQFFTSWFSGPNTTATIKIVDQQTAFGGNDFAIDDIFFTATAPLQIGNASTTPRTCPNGGGTITITATGGVPPYQFSINNGASYTTSASNPVTFTGVAPGSYTLQIRDACGNVSNTQNVTVGNVPDQTPPTISCPGTVTVSCSTDVPPPNISSVTASDNCGPVMVSHFGDVISSQSCPNRFTVTRTYRAIDGSNNSSFCTQTIRVDDQTPPTITAMPGNTTVSCAGDVPMPDDNAVSATDNCTGAVTISHGPDVVSNQSCANRYTITRTYTATDACGNATSQDQTIIVDDQMAPSGTAYAGLSNINSCKPTPNTVAPFDAASAAAGYTDNCGGPVTATQIGNTLIAGDDCNWTATYHYSVADVCGNVLGNQSYTNSGGDGTPPTLTGSPYTGTTGTNACKSQATAAAPFSPANAVQGYSDNCGGAVSATLTATDVNGTDCGWTVTYTYSVVDACGNALPGQSYSNSGSDATPPTVVCKPAQVTLVGGAASVSPADVFNSTSSSDNCGTTVIPLSVSPNSFSCAQAGQFVPVTLVARDACGNTATCTTTVKVNGVVPTCTISVTPANSTYTGGVPTDIYLGYGPQSATINVNASGGGGYSYSWSGPTAYLSSGGSSRVFTPTQPGTYTYTVTVTNINGCSTTCSVTFCVKDVRSGNNGNKVTICHIPPGNPSNAHTNSVGASAVAAHLAHGDYLGACGTQQQCGPVINAKMIAGSSDNSVIGEEVRVYPNPNNGTFTVELPYIEDEAVVLVSDMAGKLIQTRTFRDGDGQKVSLSLGDAAKGMYIVEVSYGDQRYRTKLIVR